MSKVSIIFFPKRKMKKNILHNVRTVNGNLIGIVHNAYYIDKKYFEFNFSI